MRRKISLKLRQQVAERASHRCEYCREWEEDAYDFFEIDHIRAVKHSGQTTLTNLAFSCPECNAHKGSDLGTYLEDESEFVRFFNPRTDDWFEHFSVIDGILSAQTEIGEATILILQLNAADRIILRLELSRNGRYP